MDVPNWLRWFKVFQNTASDLKVEAAIAAAAEIIVKQATHANLKGDAYKPSPAIADLDAIEDVIQDVKVDNAVANICTLLSSGATAGKIWVVTAITAYNDDGTTSRIQLSKMVGAGIYAITQKAPLARREGIDFHGILILNSGEKLRAYFSGCQTATDECWLHYNGYQIDKY